MRQALRPFLRNTGSFPAAVYDVFAVHDLNFSLARSNDARGPTLLPLAKTGGAAGRTATIASDMRHVARYGAG
jgi:hypothetical protein